MNGDTNGRTIVLVAAMGRNHVIGRGGQMPWHLPADLRHFKEITMGRPIIMGRKTWEAIGKPLPGRHNIVVSRGRPDLPDGVSLAGGLDEALTLAGEGVVMIIGGGELYRQALPLAARMELTLVDTEPKGDTDFPRWNPGEWTITATSTREADERNPYRLVFCTYERVRGDAGY